VLNGASKVAVLLGLTWLAACSVKTEQVIGKVVPTPSFNSSLFGGTGELVDEALLSKLDADTQADFLEFYNDPKFKLTPRNELLASYLLMLMEQFVYSDKTYTPQETLNHKAGNCLSLSLLTSAFAELANVPVEIHLLNDNPVFKMDGGVLTTSEHMRTVLLPAKHEKKNGVLLGRKVVIDFFDPQGMEFVANVTSAVQRSIYYSNRAAELLIDLDYDAAFANANRALDIDNENAGALNTIAVLHGRKGDQGVAESLYQYGIEHSNRSLIFWRNYSSLLRSQGRTQDLEDLLADPPLNSKDHPWQWIHAARTAYNEGEFRQAVRLYNRALNLAPNLRQVHIYAALANLAAGNPRRSASHFEKAIALADNRDDLQRYKAKYMRMKQASEAYK